MDKKNVFSIVKRKQVSISFSVAQGNKYKFGRRNIFFLNYFADKIHHD